MSALGRLSATEERALLELLAACHVVFEENPFQNQTMMRMSLRRIQKPTERAVQVFSSSKVIGRGR